MTTSKLLCEVPECNDRSRMGSICGDHFALIPDRDKITLAVLRRKAKRGDPAAREFYAEFYQRVLTQLASQNEQKGKQ